MEESAENIVEEFLKKVKEGHVTKKHEEVFANKKTKKKSVNYMLRIPEKLKHMIAEKAMEEYRPANQEAIVLLCRALGVNPKDLDK